MYTLQAPLGLFWPLLKKIEKMDFSTIEKAIDSFQDNVLNCKNRLDQKVLIICQKMLSKLQLNSLSVKLTKEAGDEESNTEKEILYLVGRILGDCYSPLNYMISKQIENENNERRFLCTAVESYLRGAGILDSAAFLSGDNTKDDEGFAKDCLSIADAYVNKCGILAQKMKRKSELLYLESVTKVCENFILFFV